MTGYEKAPAVTTGEGPQKISSNLKPSRGGRGTEAPARPSTHTEGNITDHSPRRGPIVPPVLFGTSPATIAVYAVVKSHLNRKTGMCCPSLNQVAKEAGCARNTADAAVHRIAELGEWAMHMTRGHRTYYEFPDFDYGTKPWERTRKRRNDGDSEQSPVSQMGYRQHVSELPASQNEYRQRLKMNTASVSKRVPEPNKRTNGNNQSPKPPTGAGDTERENHTTAPVSRGEFNATLSTLRDISPKHDYPKGEAKALADAYRRGLTSAQIISGVRTQAEAQRNTPFAPQLDMLIGHVGPQTHASAGHVAGPTVVGFGDYVERQRLRSDKGDWLTKLNTIWQAKSHGYPEKCEDGEALVRVVASELDATKAAESYLKAFGAKAGA